MVTLSTDSFRAGDRVGILEMPSRLTGAAETAVMDTVAAAVPASVRSVILSFGGVEFMDSSGASLLVKLCVQAKRRRQRLMCFGLSPHHRGVFKLTGLDKAIRVCQNRAEALSRAGEPSTSKLLRESRELPSDAAPSRAGERRPLDERYWAQPVARIGVADVPSEAVNLNVAGRRAVGPVEGFGPMWQKTYRLKLHGVNLTPFEAMRLLKVNFPGFQPRENRFYASAAGISPGEVILINSSTPGGPVYTGVVVLYADDESFTLITPQGHPESGWVTFSAFGQNAATVVQIQGLARASDPVYEIAFRFVGSKVQENIWRHVLASMAAHVNVKPEVEVQKTCLDPALQWSQAKNVWRNAQIRSMMYAAAGPLHRVGGSRKT